MDAVSGRDEITHRVLALASTGMFTRSWRPTGWRVHLDQESAPENARWALTTLKALGLIRWWAAAENVQFAMATTAGLAQLKRWDTELLGPPAPAPPARSQPPCLDDITWSSEDERRLMHAIFEVTPKDLEQDDETDQP